MANGRLSLMIISSQKFCDRLKQCIVRLSDKVYDKEIIVKLAENASDISNSAVPNTEVDFVAVVVDTSEPQAVENCKSDISFLMPLFVASRICVINGSCRGGTTESAKNLIEFADKFSIPYFNGHVMDDLSCRVTGERILKLASFASGYTTGFSGIIPTPKDLGLLT